MGDDFRRWWTEHSKRQDYLVTDLMTGYQMARRDATAAYEAGGDEARQRAERQAVALGAIRNMARYGWEDKDNIRVLFEEIGKLADAALVADQPAEAGGEVR